jgi:predicted DCC family thiol-disulfide oxidoreductase YuxK
MNQVVFFDGVCLLCNGFVDFLLRRDVERVFQFAPLQGEKAKVLLPAGLRDGLDTLVLWNQGQMFVRSDAVLMILGQLGGAWTLARLGWAVPRPLRDLAYRLVAARRYAWFGKRDTCRLPTAEERARFLD